MWKFRDPRWYYRKFKSKVIAEGIFIYIYIWTVKITIYRSFDCLWR